MNCRTCGAELDPRRVALGYDYCTKDACQRLCLQRSKIARVGVDKAADQFTKADQELSPSAAPRTVIEAADDRGHSPARPVPHPSSSRRRLSTLEKLQALDHALTRELDARYARFCANEITAAEMRKEQDELIRAFDVRVMAENIRYRSMLRRPRPA